ncbi:MAG: DNA polymerase III subunit delta [Calditrichaeota bacterium]|nr:MAG: DNA polymerase III subunit delta [Calditrichota bacterium]
MATFHIEKVKSVDALPAVIYLAGAENYLIDKHTQKVIDVCVPQDVREFNFDMLYGTDVDARRVIDIASSYPMMADKRLVIVRDIDKMSTADQKKLLAYAEKPNQTTCLVLISRAASSRSQTLKKFQDVAVYISCKPLYENQVGQWIEKEIRRIGYQISPDASAFLAMQVGTDLQTLKNEIDKITLFLGDKKEITREVIVQVAGMRKEYTIFAFQNALGSRDLKQALWIYHNIKYAQSNLGIIAQLSRFFTNILIATGYGTSRQESADLAKKTRMSPYFVNDLHKFKRNYSTEELLSALENIRHIDYILKQFPVHPESIMELLFVQIVKGYPADKLPYAGKIS